MSDSLSEPDVAVYFLGCDMGGWHNKKKDEGDALAICRWSKGDLFHVEATANLTFFPVEDDGPLEKWISAAISDNAKINVSIDAALGWPTSFPKLVEEAPEGQHDFSFNLTSAIQNPYLYRDIERFINDRLLKGKGNPPLTAVGDKFGNNFTKAQALVAWLNKRLASPYRPPFDPWDRAKAEGTVHTLIEVYSAASMKSKQFKQLVWPLHTQDMESVGSSDIADAKRCAMTGVCYAREVGVLPRADGCPGIYCPDHSLVPEAYRASARQEGWIFAPFDNQTAQSS